MQWVHRKSKAWPGRGGILFIKPKPVGMGEKTAFRNTSHPSAQALTTPDGLSSRSVCWKNITCQQPLTSFRLGPYLTHGLHRQIFLTGGKLENYLLSFCCWNRKGCADQRTSDEGSVAQTPRTPTSNVSSMHHHNPSLVS